MNQYCIAPESRDEAGELANCLKQHGYVFHGYATLENVIDAVDPIIVDFPRRAFFSRNHEEPGLPVEVSDAPPLTWDEFRQEFGRNAKHQVVWKRLYYMGGIEFLFEGHTYADLPCGSGATYLEGKLWQMGIFSPMGMILGREYGLDGELRFEGEFDELGREKYRVRRGEYGSPTITHPTISWSSGIWTDRLQLKDSFYIVQQNKPVWHREYYRNDGTTLWYEGSDRKEEIGGCRVGRIYFPDGCIFREGILQGNNLLLGREYYPGNRIRFEGVYVPNTGYGPSYPRYGTFYNQDGDVAYEGEFLVSRGGVGWPTVKKPEGFGRVFPLWAPKNE